MKRWLTGLVLLVCTCSVSAQDRDISFFTIFDGTLAASSLQNFEWMADGQHFTRTARMNNGVEIRKVDIQSGEFEVIVESRELREAYPDAGDIVTYSFSEDGTRILISTDVETLWRRSSRAVHYVYDLPTSTFHKLGKGAEKQQYAELSPSGRKVAYVRNNNLFWVDLESGNVTQVTRDGYMNEIINGSTDWVYEEEFGFAKAWFWSPESDYIAFYRFDESAVSELSLMEGLTRTGTSGYRYPRAGENNADVRIGIYHLSSGEITWAELPDGIEYVPRVQWTADPGILAVRVMNRLQNHLQLYLVDAESGLANLTWELESDTWIDITDDFIFTPDGNAMIYTSDMDGYNHLYRFDFGGEKRQITRGEWEVTQLIGYDHRQETLYYSSTESSSIERHIYSIALNGTSGKKLVDTPGWHSAVMSPNHRYMYHVHSDVATPPVYQLRYADGRKIRTLEDNRTSKEVMDRFRLPQVSFTTLSLKNAGDLNAMVIKPPDFDPSEKYPLLVYVYGGPGSQSVTNYYRMGHTQLWHYYLATLGYVVVSVDNRGTGGRGRDFRTEIYRKLGQVETDDQVEAARHFSQKEYIDEERIGIWGWSYGGYLSTLALAEGNELFSMAIAVAPVTHWRYYDTIYTERYMQTPELNRKGYEAGAPLNRAQDIHGDYLLIHGMSDDNVHVQNAIEMADALIRNNVQFQSMFYPNRNHGIQGGNTRLHLFRLMTDFVLEKL